MRLPRLKAEGEGFYHCVSRVVDRKFIFRTMATGSEEASFFVDLMRKLEAFSGVKVLDYALMSNHFHVLCQVPSPRFVPERELLDRIEAGYNSAKRQAVEEQIAAWRKEPNQQERIERLLNNYRKRMYDLSIFFKELKGRFAQWYNRRNERTGVLWAERFKSVLVEGGNALRAIAAYIDLNPVRAGLCADPGAYPYCGYGEATRKGIAAARDGIRTIIDPGQTECWEKIEVAYRKYLYMQGGLSSKNKAPVFDRAQVEQICEQVSNRTSDFAPPPGHRIGPFTNGLILGTENFVRKHIDRLKQQTAHKSLRGPRPLMSLGIAVLWVFRLGHKPSDPCPRLG